MVDWFRLGQTIGRFRNFIWTGLQLLIAYSARHSIKSSLDTLTGPTRSEVCAYVCSNVCGFNTTGVVVE